MSATPSARSTSSKLKTYRPKISACLVAHNDEVQIGRCLESLRNVVDEVIVVHDGPCSDATLEIARANGARVYQEKHLGNPEPHRVTSFQYATGDWILVLDPDEFLSPELKKNLRRLVESGKADGYYFLWRFWNGASYYTRFWPHRIGVVRRSSLRFLAILHPDWRIRGTILEVPYRLEHQPAYNNCTWSAYQTKWRHWLRLHAAQILTPIQDLPQFQFGETQFVRHIEWIRRWGAWGAPFLFCYFLFGAMLRVPQPDRWSLRWYFFYQALYYAELCIHVGRLKHARQK